MSCDFTFWLVPSQLGGESPVWLMYGDQASVNIRAARKFTDSTQIYVLHVNPEPPSYLMNWIKAFSHKGKTLVRPL